MEPVSIPHPIRVHLSSAPGIYTVINYTPDVMYCQTSSKTLIVPVADFQLIAGGLNNEHVSPGEKEHFLQTINAYSNRKTVVKITNSVRRSAMLDDGERHHLKVTAHKIAIKSELPAPEPEPDKYMLAVVSTLFKQIADLKTELNALRKEIGSTRQTKVDSDPNDDQEEYKNYKAMMESERERIDEQIRQDQYDYEEEMQRQENEYQMRSKCYHSDSDIDLPF
jgi:hypothetical protein